jgi:hypothetical protein
MTSVDPKIIGQLKNIHREFRTALLNKKYYACRLHWYRTVNRYFEILIAVGTTGTGVAGFAIWKSGAGIVAWGIISGASIVLSTLKPIIDLPKQIERYSKLSGAYSKIFESFRVMEQEFDEGGLTAEHIEKFKQLRNQLVDLATDDDQKVDVSLVKRLEDEVNREIPVTSLWMPSIPLRDDAPASQKEQPVQIKQS